MVRTILLKMDNWLAKLTEILLIIIGIPFFTMIIIEVLARKLASTSLFGVYELAGYLAIWIYMVGAYQAYRKGELARLTFLVKRLPSLWQKRIGLINQLMILIALLFLALSGLLFIFSPAVITQESVSFALPVFYFYLGIPVGLILMALRTLIQLFIRDDYSLCEETEVLE